jgi:hypothetical protein
VHHVIVISENFPFPSYQFFELLLRGMAMRRGVSALVGLIAVAIPCTAAQTPIAVPSQGEDPQISLAVASQSAQTLKNSIFYSGQLDGFAGSAANCFKSDCAERLDDAVNGILDLKAKAPGSILVGMGDNFAPGPGENFKTQLGVNQRMNFTFGAGNLPAIDFMHRAGYDAVVPGLQDFYFGAEFVRQAEKQLNMVATNLVRTPMQPSTCPAYPQLPAMAILLANQISTSIASGNSSSATGASGAGGGKKGGKKGGGGGSSASSSGGAAGSGTGGAAPGACQTQAGAEASKGTDTKHPAPKLLWPDGNSIYPWTTEVVMSEKLPLDSDPSNVYLCSSEGPKPLPTFDSSKCTLLKLNSDSSSSNPHFAITDPNDLGVKEDGSIVPITQQRPKFRLLGGATGELCYTYKAKGNHTYKSCTTITVQEPMFQHVWLAPANTNYIIFGALAPDTLNGLSSIDSSWYEDKHEPDVARKVEVKDPTSAILQALHAFNILNPEQSGINGVLLAQMTPSEAKALADSLSESSRGSNPNHVMARIDLIISAADLPEATPKANVDINDPERNLPNSDVSEGNEGDPDQPYFIPVFTPSPVFQKKDCLAQDATKCLSRITPDPVPPPTGGSATAPAPEVAMVQLENFPSDTIHRHNSPVSNRAETTTFCTDRNMTPRHRWECDVLQRMLKDPSAKVENSSDLAILEEKDFDFQRSSWNPNQTVQPTTLESAVILWKAGRLARVSLLGSTIEALLQQNDKFQTSNFQVLPSSRSVQRLKILGITKVGQVYYINGMPLSESQTYSVATTDRLANTTSDFPQLAQRDLDNPSLFPIHGNTVQIADIAPSTPSPSPQPAAPCHESLCRPADLEGAETLPVEKQKAPSAKLPSYSSSSRTLSEKEFNGLSNDEKDEQLRPMFRVILEQGALSYSAATPNQQDSYIGVNFGGVSNPNVSAAYSKSESALQNARMEWYPTHGRRMRLEDVGLDELVNVAESYQGSLAPPTTTPAMTTTGELVPERLMSVTANNITLSPFLEFQTPRFPYWKALVVRGIATDNVAKPAPQYLPGCTAGKTVTFISNGAKTTETCDAGATSDDFHFSLQKTWSLGESVGTRIEKDDFRYAEIGFTHQRSHEVLSAVGVVDAGTENNVTYFCSLTGNQSLSSCAGDMPAEAGGLLTSQYSNYSQTGGYVLALWTKPVINHVVLQGSGFGNFFAFGNKNQSVLTHFAFNAMGTVLINLPANFSFGPTWNEFFFQDNATQRVGTSLLRKTLGAQLNWSFDWHTGVSLKEFYGNSQ